MRTESREQSHQRTIKSMCVETKLPHSGTQMANKLHAWCGVVWSWWIGQNEKTLFCRKNQTVYKGAFLFVCNLHGACKISAVCVHMCVTENHVSCNMLSLSVIQTEKNFIIVIFFFKKKSFFAILAALENGQFCQKTTSKNDPQKI